MGSAWRMPTHEEQLELINNCTITWTTQNGVKGYKVTGPNGNSIFLPTTGVYSNSLYFIYGHTGRMGQPISLLVDPIDFSWFKPGLQLSIWACCGAL